MTKETREKIRMSRIGKRWDEETKRKLSESHKKLWEDDDFKKEMKERCGHNGFKKGYVPWNKGKKFGPEWGKVRMAGKPSWNKGIAYKAISGEKHWNWQGGKTREAMRIRGSLEYKQWRSFIFERDGFVCQICGIHGGNLRANHIKRFADVEELRMDPNNGITICRKCDYDYVLAREREWESYFNFNLETRGSLQRN